MIKMSQKYSQDEAQALVKALKEGNQLAFSIVYKTYAAQTFSLAFKYLLNKELAEDAVQNLFLKLWLKKEEIDETKPINRYLFTMLKNDLLNTLRDSKKNIYLLENDLVEVLLAASDYYAVFKLVGGIGLADVGDLLIVDSNAALLDVAAGVGLGVAEP